MMDHKPCAVIASCTGSHPEEIIKLILGIEELPDSTCIEDGIKAYPWQISTKYYTANVNLCSLEKKTLGSEQFAQSVEAAVIKFDSKRDDGLEIVGSWLSFLKEFEPEIQILLCDRCEEDPSVGIPKVKAQQWCIERGFELVELNPELDVEWEEEQDFIETTGIKRVVQAMHAHLWPNLLMKQQSTQLSRNVQTALNGPRVEELEQDLDNLLIVNNAEEAFDGEEVDSGALAGFSTLFDQLHTMKEQVSGMPSENRKAAAEEVVMAFWRAIGGDEEELDGFSDSDPDSGASLQQG